MFVTHKFKKSFSMLTVLFLIFTGSVNATIIKFSATLDGAQANAGSGTGSLASGIGLAWLDDQTNDFSWQVSWSGLNGVTAAHFHGPALANANAGVQVPISVLSNPSSGNTVLIASQASDLMNGLWYINIHTTTFPGGEIRGQVQQLVDVAAPNTLVLLSLTLLGLITKRRSKVR
jgi:hypothetical protein